MSSAENPAKPVEETKAEVSHHAEAFERDHMPVILPLSLPVRRPCLATQQAIAAPARIHGKGRMVHGWAPES